MNEYLGAANLEVMSDAKNYNAYLSHLVRKFMEPSDRILDFGAGIGTFTLPLAEQGFNVACVESDPKQLLRITQQGVVGYSALQEAPDDTYDYIFSLNVLEHIEDDVAVLSMLSRKLKRGGRLMIYVPAFQLLFSSMDKAVGHYRRYSMGQLTNRVIAAGLEVIKADYVDSLGFFASLLFKYSGADGGSLSRTGVMLFDRLAFPLSLIIDHATKKLLGKNLLLIAHKN